MSIALSGKLVTDGLIFYCDTNNPKSYKGRPTTNNATSPLDLYGWCTSGANSATLARDYNTAPSPAGGIPMKMTMTGNDPYTNTYNSSPWNLYYASSGQTWTVSVWVKANRYISSTGEGLFLFEANSNGNYTVLTTAGSITFTPEWQRISATKTFDQPSTQYVQVRLDGPNSYTAGDVVWWDGLQLERYAFPTQFQNGVRLDTTSFLDMTGRCTIDIANASYTNNIYLTYNGTVGYPVSSLAPFMLGNSPRSIFAWIKTSYTGNQCIFSSGTAANSQAFNLVMYTYQKIGVMGYNNDFYPSTGANITDNKWHHVGATFDGNNILNTYVDGVLDNSASRTFTTTGQNNYIGKSNHGGVDNWFNGSISSVQIYNRALNPYEVLQNYNAGKALV